MRELEDYLDKFDDGRREGEGEATEEEAPQQEVKEKVKNKTFGQFIITTKMILRL